MIPGAPAQELEADLLGLRLGQEGGRQPAVLTTDLFELHVTCQQFQCVEDGTMSSPSQALQQTGPLR